jgi:hypothetical protein
MNNEVDAAEKILNAAALLREVAEMMTQKSEIGDLLTQYYPDLFEMSLDEFAFELEAWADDVTNDMAAMNSADEEYND